MIERLTRALAGTVDARAYAAMRVSLAALVLIRTTDALAPLLALDHHGWVSGLEGAPWSDSVTEPALNVPLLPGLGVLLIPAVAGLLVVVRTGAAIGLLLGLWPRLCALVTGLSGYALMAADRFRYLHHMHLLWTTCLLFALVPSASAWALGAARPTEGLARGSAERWPLVVLRCHLLIVYAASGLAKLEPSWLDGTNIERLVQVRLLEPWPVATFGPVLVAWSVVAVELGLVPLLAWSPTRKLGVALGVAFHLATAQWMMVSIFPAIMIVLLGAFLVPDPQVEAPPRIR